jgi:hypothetical protein
MEILVEACKIQRGDYLFNSLAGHPAYLWVKVKDIEYKDGDIWIHTTSWFTIKHPREAVFVRKKD